MVPHLIDFLEWPAGTWPAATAVVDGEQRFTYTQLRKRVFGLSEFFEQRQLHGRRIALLEPNSMAFLEITFAAAAAGAVLVPLNTRLAEAELQAILADAQPSLCLCSPDLLGKLRGLVDEDDLISTGGRPPAKGPAYSDLVQGRYPSALPRRQAEQGLAQLYYTSGTTGRPKGVMLTHDNVYLHALAAARELGIKHSDIWAHAAPMFHLADAWATLSITSRGGRHVMIRKFDPSAVLSTFEKECVTITNLIPTMLNLLIKHPQVRDTNFSRLRRILSGGAPIAPALVAQIMEIFGCEYVQTYGMTETSPFLTLGLLPEHLLALPEAERLVYQAKAGRPFEGIRLRVVDSEQRPVARDAEAVGEIQVKGPTVTCGYWKRPEDTQAAFTEDGFLKTGDLATWDAEGFVDIVDRIKDLIITGGENVYTTEVEAVLYEHEAVFEAAVYGMPDERWGEAVHAAVVLKPDAPPTSAADLIAHCKEHLASYKAPKQIVFLSELPKTGSGKISKRDLRKKAV
jgi:fatty-acyl-CoA synthase